MLSNVLCLSECTCKPCIFDNLMHVRIFGTKYINTRIVLINNRDTFPGCNVYSIRHLVECKIILSKFSLMCIEIKMYNVYIY